MIIINEKTIRKVISHKEIIDSVEEAFTAYEKGDFIMPDRIHVNNGKNTLLYMPCFAGDVFGTKSLTVFPENSSQGKPMIDGFMTLHDSKTGSALAMIDGKILTALRTGGVGGAGSKILSDRNSSVLGIIGAGAQGIYQAIFISEARPIKEIRVMDSNDKSLKKFVETLRKELPQTEIHVCDNPEDLLRGCHIVVTATNSDTPVLPNNPDLLKGKLFIGIGSYKPSMREFPEELYPLLNKVYTDTNFACEESGDLVYPLEKKLIVPEQISTIGAAMGIPNEGEETLLFKSVGMALLDLFVAKTIYHRVINLRK